MSGVPETGSSEGAPTTGRDEIVELIEHLGHLLPNQGPISTFVHHNTLHGLQHRPFDEALAAAESFYGAHAYPPVDVSRAHYRAGRITDADLDAVIAERGDIADAEVVGAIGGRTVTDADIRRIHLVYGVNPIDPAELRFLISEREATRRFMDDVTEEARSLLLDKAMAELRDGIDRVGRDATLGGWVGRLVGLDIAAAVTSAAREELSRGSISRRSVSSLLEALGVAESRRDGYLELVDAAIDGVGGSEVDRARRAWLSAEGDLVDRIARRHLGVAGNLQAIERAMLADLEAFAVRSLWAACLAAFDALDPMSPTDPWTLGTRDPDAAVDRLGELFVSIQRSGGPVITLEPGDRAEVENAVRPVLEQLRTEVASDPARGGDATLREGASAAWFALRELDDDRYGRVGFDALTALAVLASDDRLTAVVSKLAARDPLRILHEEVNARVGADLASFGRDTTHADLLARLTGQDVTAVVNGYMVRLCAAFLDQGQAAWRMPDRTLGFYRAWRSSVAFDPTLAITGLRRWPPKTADLPEDPVDAVLRQLDRLGVSLDDAHAYLGRLVATQPGWAGMMNWHGNNPGFALQKTRPADLLGYLAVRLTVEVELVADTLARGLRIEVTDVAGISERLRDRALEYDLRTKLHAGALPSIVAEVARDLERRDAADRDWANVAIQALTWAGHPDVVARSAVARDVWRLFRLAQLAGWSAGEVRTLSPSVRDRVLGALDAYPESDHRSLWLSAFERHYREEILSALAANRGRGRWQVRDSRPRAQVVFCIDEREESMHRAVDELDPHLETLGAGGFFNMAMNFSGLDDHDVTPLCPAGVIPTNRVKEVAREDEGSRQAATARRDRRLWRETAENTYWELKRNAVSGLFLAQLVGLVQSVPLIGRVLAPWNWAEIKERFDRALLPMPQTQLTVDAARFDGLGFTLNEQADRVEIQLRNIGLTHGFGRLVVFIGHGSSSLNNPHESAHDCGACGGKHGAPNARAFAAIANRRPVREELARRGTEIPDDTWFVGGVHNTASDRNTFFDVQDVPETHRDEWDQLHRDLDQARALSARERCTRFDSAPKTSSLRRSVRHVEERSRDLSQVRPEWGHCTNAVAVIGRRALTQGLFLDRRTFVISYDPNGDPDGSIVQRILLALGPVGAGINLEYYFSTVNNRMFGCDTKVPHNVTGLLGVMEGAASDLRTGLPKQMIELHEPMRLLLIVEASTDILGGIYGAQPAIAELLDNEWIHLVAMDPGDGHFDLFVPGKGFVGWEGEPAALSVVKSSYDYYRGRRGFLAPVRIEPTAAG